MAKKTGLSELALFLLRLGTTAFGGPAAHIAMMEEEVVNRRKWLTRQHFLDLIGATNLIPGPNSTEMAIQIGYIRGNAPTVLNAAGQISAHWIGNRTDVEDQARQSVTGLPSFGMPSNEAVEKKLREINGYAPLFGKAFPGEKDPVNVGNFSKAVGGFERTLVTPSRFDSFSKGNTAALNEREKRGLKTYMEAGCIMCHVGTYAGGQVYQKFGIFEPYWKYTKSEEIDEGRFAVTKNDMDKYVFKVPLLRNVAKTSPYFHDGSIKKLEDAVWIMDKIQLGKDLNKPQVEEVVTFLKSLTGKIPEDALKVPLLASAD